MENATDKVALQYALEISPDDYLQKSLYDEGIT